MQLRHTSEPQGAGMLNNSAKPVEIKGSEGFPLESYNVGDTHILLDKGCNVLILSQKEKSLTHRVVGRVKRFQM